jgi:chromosome segregation ATPase
MRDTTPTDDTTEGLRERYFKALSPTGLYLREDGLPATLDAVLAVRDEELERLRAELAETKQVLAEEIAATLARLDKAEARADHAEKAGQVHRERATQWRQKWEQLRTTLADSELCAGCMLREQQRDRWADTSRQNGVTAEQTKQAWYREQDRAREAEAELERLRAELAEAQNLASVRENLLSEAWDAHHDTMDERDTLIDEVRTLQEDLEEFGEAQKAWVQFRRERDALKALIENFLRGSADRLRTGDTTADLADLAHGYWTLTGWTALDTPETPDTRKDPH